MVAEHGDPAMMTRHLVELVAMDEQKAPAVRRFMNQLIDHFDIAENDAAILAQHLVVVAGNEHHPVAMPGPAQQFLDDGVLGLRPVDAPAHRPEIDDVADQIGLFSRMFAQEIEESVRLARPRAKVDIREKNGSDLGHDRKIRRPRDPEVTASLSFCFESSLADGACVPKAA